MTPNFNNIADRYLEEEMSDSQKKLIALGLASAAALPGTAYLGQKAGEALRDDPVPKVQHVQPAERPAPGHVQPPPAVVQPDLNATDINATQVILDATTGIVIFTEDDRGGAVTGAEAQALVDEDRNASVIAMRNDEGQVGIILNRIRRTWGHIGRENRDPGYAYDTFARPGIQDWTIGYGHHDSFIDEGIRAQVLELLGLNDWEPIRQGQQSLSPEQMDALFRFDYDRKELAVQNSVGASWAELPQWVRAAAVNGMFRGDLGPDTRGYMRNNNWAPDENGMNAVAREYQRHTNWDDDSGVAARMRRNQRRFLIYGLYRARLQEIARENP